MAVVTRSLALYGLWSAEDAARESGWSVRSLQRKAAAGELPVIQVGGGRGKGSRPVYLYDPADVRRLGPPTRGYPAGRPRKEKKA